MTHKTKIIIILAVGVFAFAVFLLIGLKGLKPPKLEKVELDFWSVYDDSKVWQGIIKSFNAKHPNVKINYYKKPFESYEKELVDALAAGRGPDIFSIHNTWLPKHIDKLAPLTEKQMTLKEFSERFVDVAWQDFVGGDSYIYALPASVDTLALYWNKDLFNSAGIAQPPSDWNSFIEAVKKLTLKDEANNISRSGAAIGTARNINRSIDILSLLMLQTGAKMVSDKKDRASFDRSVTLEGRPYYAGQVALEFYTAFANPRKDAYTWNQSLDYSIDAFVEGKTAMMFNYSYHIPTIRAKAPYLNFGVASMPQTAEAKVLVNYASYWGQAVSKFAKDRQAAWTFLIWLTEKENLRNYLEATKRPSARRDLIPEQKDDSDLGVFAQQALSARSWYQVDNLAIENIFADMIESVVLGQQTAKEAISKAASQVSLLMRK